MTRMNDLLKIYKKKLKGETDFTPKEKVLIKECKKITKKEGDR